MAAFSFKYFFWNEPKKCKKNIYAIILFMVCREKKINAKTGTKLGDTLNLVILKCRI
jgi:hypothetical protein